MLTHLTLNAFKNHATGSFSWQERNIIVGANGSGKTNLLEAIYLLVNGTPVPGKTMTQSVQDAATTFSLGGKIQKNGLEYGCHIGCDVIEKSVRFSWQGSETKRSSYLETSPDRAVFFSPLEMNILYLGPSLRRDLLDESIMLAYPSFTKIRRDYLVALHNRNALLKSIREGRSALRELDAWDRLFTEHAVRFYGYRSQLLDFIRDRMDSIETLLEWKYQVRFDYMSHTDLSDVESSILERLKSEQWRDVATGHTSTGPHLDDFVFHVEHSWRLHRSSEYLSRGENKTILLWLKFLTIQFLESQSKKNTILLIDDLFSELDEEHTNLILSAALERQVFITSQNPASFYPFCQDFNTIQLY